MLAEFTVGNYKSIRTSQTLSFVATREKLMDGEYCYLMPDGIRLMKLGVIYGSNASGKSNLIEAIDFFKHIMTDAPIKKSDPIDVIPFLLDETSRRERTYMSAVLYLCGERYTLSIEYDQDRIYQESLTVYASRRPAIIYKRAYNECSDSADVVFGLKSGITKEDQKTIQGNTINNSSVLAAFGKSNVSSSRLNEVFQYLDSDMALSLTPNESLSSFVKRNLERDADGRIKRFLVEILKQSDFNITNLELQNEDIAITPEMEELINQAPLPQEVRDEAIRKGKFQNVSLLFSHRTDFGEYQLLEALESRGTIRYLGMGIILYKLLSADRYISIDEIEASIHYELLGYFLRLYLANSEQNSQLLVSTHDVNLLDENFIRRDAVWFTDKNSEGETILSRLSDAHIHKTVSPYNAYRQGKLVKLPFLGSQYLDRELFKTDVE